MCTSLAIRTFADDLFYLQVSLIDVNALCGFKICCAKQFKMFHLHFFHAVQNGNGFVVRDAVVQIESGEYHYYEGVTYQLFCRVQRQDMGVFDYVVGLLGALFWDAAGGVFGLVFEREGMGSVEVHLGVDSGAFF
jgi:hypothetical protein